MKGLGKGRHARRGGGHPRMLVFLVALAALSLAATIPPSEAAELDVAWVRIEINATAGDVGLHLMVDGGPRPVRSPRRTCVR
jgi:hypothetical protein